MKNQEQVIEKIRKLLNLSQSSNENEAQSAMLMAQKLMAQYNIAMSQVEDAVEDHDVVEESADKKAHRTRWKRALARCVADNFKCDMYMKGNGSYATVFVGKKESLEICKAVYEAAVRFIDLNFAKWWNMEGKWQGWEELPLFRSIRMKDSYARGFIHNLKEKFEAQKVTADKEGWGLVLVKDADVTAHMQAMKFAGSISNSATAIDSTALRQGYKDCKDKFGETGQRKIGD